MSVMNTIIIPTGSYKLVFMKNFLMNMNNKQNVINEIEITNHK